MSASSTETSDASNSNKDKAVLSDLETESESVPESLKIFCAGSELHKITYFFYTSVNYVVLLFSIIPI